jgi:hypothetical protein
MAVVVATPILSQLQATLVTHPANLHLKAAPLEGQQGQQVVVPTKELGVPVYQGQLPPALMGVLPVLIQYHQQQQPQGLEVVLVVTMRGLAPLVGTLQLQRRGVQGVVNG